MSPLRVAVVGIGNIALSYTVRRPDVQHPQDIPADSTALSLHLGRHDRKS